MGQKESPLLSSHTIQAQEYHPQQEPENRKKSFIQLKKPSIFSRERWRKKFFRNDYYKVDGEAAVVQNVDEDLDEITFKTLDGRIVSTTIDDDRIEQYEANDDEEYREMSLSYSDDIQPSPDRRNLL